jgi:hypothetical protein
MKVNMLSYLSIIYILSCNSENVNFKAFTEEQKGYTFQIDSCITARDSIFNHGDYIKYIKIDSSIGVEVKLGDEIDTMDFVFPCNTANVLVPKLFSYDSGAILIYQGAGQHFRFLTYYYVNGGKLTNRSYETNIVNSNSPSVMIYKRHEYADRIYAYYFYSKKTSYKILPKKYENEEIKEIEVWVKHMLIKFKSGEQLKMKI